MSEPVSRKTGEEKLAEGSLPEGSVPEVEVALQSGALVIADLHLAPGGDARSERFIDWCASVGEAARVPQLIVMGDLFDFWVGARQAKLAGSREVLEALAMLAGRGVEVLVIPGNRDAMLGRAFEARSGARLYPEGFVGLTGDGERLAFVHGDSLCTLDHGYQRLRRLWRRRSTRWLSRHLPLWVARRVARRVRAQSESSKRVKLPEEKSIRPAAVQALAKATGASAVVCGHAHDVRDEVLGDNATRFVVIGAWGWEGDLWRISETEGGTARLAPAPPLGLAR